MSDTSFYRECGELAHMLYSIHALIILSLFCHLYHSGGDVMKCPRCQGRMYSEKYYDFVRSFDAWKCSCCGELVDSTILANRVRSSSTFLG